MSKDDRDKMDEALKQFSEIRFIRDRIAHDGAWEADHEDGERRWRSSNFPQGRRPEKITSVFFTIADLQNASHDLLAIRNQIDAIIVDENTSVRRMVEDAGFFGPWHYKPVQPGR